MPANVISGFLPGDRIDLAAARFDSGGTVQLLANNLHAGRGHRHAVCPRQ
jgi:hypothetical protein